MNETPTPNIESTLEKALIDSIDGAFGCSQARQRAGLSYARTCGVCQLGPCKYPNTMLAKT